MRFPLPLFFLPIIGMLFSNCGCPCGCPSGSPSSYDSSSLGVIKLNDSSKYWLDSLHQNLIFTNTSGTINSIELNELQQKSTRVVSDIEPLVDKDGCVVENGHIVYYFSHPIQQYTLRDQIGNRLDIVRSKFNEDYEKVRQNHNEVNNISDALYVLINQYYQFNINPRSTYPKARYTIHDTLTLGNKQYTNVLFSYYDSVGNSTHNPSRPYGVYYKIPDGILGYVFVNGEFWYVK